MQAITLCLLLLPVAIRAVPCTDSTQAPPTTRPPPPPTTQPPPTTPPPTTPEPSTTPEMTTEYVPPPRAFPIGTYALPRPDVGCPLSTGFRSFYRLWDTEDYYNGNSWPADTEHFLGYMKRDGFKIYFCVKVDAERGGDYDWPAGDYCIVKKGDCPFGFNEGSIFWDDEDDENQNTEPRNTAYHIDGVFNDDTQIDFCCRNDGSADRAIKLPIRRSFYLMRYQGACQRVAEMDVIEEVVQWDDEDSGNNNSKSGAHPLDTGNSANHKLHFCYYERPSTSFVEEL